MIKKESISGSTWGKLLRVDLTKSRLKTEKIPKNIFKQYLGGRGLGVKIICDELEPKAEPLSGDNILVFTPGTLTGVSIPLACKYEVVTKSPLTGTITGANAGGYFGARLKHAGYDAIVVTGRAKSPKYLMIDNEDVTLNNAQALWGRDTHETTDTIVEDLGKSKVSIACIGPAGERLVRYANIINDKHRTAGRGGVGAVMGSKRLKAIAVSGSKRVNVVDRPALKKLNRKILKKIKETTVTNVNLREFGTIKILDSVNDYKVFGTRNFQQNYFDFASKINAEQLKKKCVIDSNTCFSCPIACKRVTKVGKKRGEGPEFETVWAFGAQCGIDDLKAITKANYLCNELGLDSISTGNTIGCAMELSEKGFIKEKFRFGDRKIIEELTRSIAYREGIGDKLAEGSFRFADGMGHPELSMSVKKLELPAYDPRGAQAQGLGYATSTRGACHVRAFVIKSDLVAGPQKTDFESINTKTKLVKNTQDLAAVIDSIGMCLFSAFVCDKEDYRVYLEVAAGLKFKSTDEILKAGERIWNLEHIFNRKAGLRREDDRLPARFTREKVTDSLDNEHVWPENELIEDYYKIRGWTKAGIPTKNKLKQLDI